MSNNTASRCKQNRSNVDTIDRTAHAAESGTKTNELNVASSVTPNFSGKMSVGQSNANVSGVDESGSMRILVDGTRCFPPDVGHPLWAFHNLSRNMSMIWFSFFFICFCVLGFFSELQSRRFRVQVLGFRFLEAVLPRLGHLTRFACGLARSVWLVISLFPPTVSVRTSCRPRFRLLSGTNGKNEQRERKRKNKGQTLA